MSFVADPDWLAFDPNPSKPAFELPPGAVDAHCHVFGPGDQFPYAPERKYTPCDAPKEQLWAVRDFLGFSRNVIVQATCHGNDNRALADALQASAGRARGVATVNPSVSNQDLAALHAAGVRGVRFNFVKRLVDKMSTSDILAITQRVVRLQWHVVIYFESQDLEKLFDFFAALPATIVIDHMGRPDVDKGAFGADFDLFMRLLDENPNIYTKVSCPERLSVSGPPAYTDVVPFARRLVESFPTRVLWGTDWPHPNMRTHMPDDGQLVNFIPTIAVTKSAQRKLLVDNPMRLYWPEDVNHGTA